MLMQIPFTATVRENRLSDHHVHLRSYLVVLHVFFFLTGFEAAPPLLSLYSPTPEKEIGVCASEEELQDVAAPLTLSRDSTVLCLPDIAKNMSRTTPNPDMDLEQF